MKEKLLAEISELTILDKMFFLPSKMILALLYHKLHIILKLYLEMLQGSKAYDGPRFHILWQTSYAVPSALFEFVCVIEHGVDIKSQLRFGASKTDSAMVQLLQYNCY